MTKKAERPEISEAHLHAYVDGQLAPAEHLRVEAWLEANPDKRAEVAEWQRQNAAFEAIFPESEANTRVDGMVDEIAAARSSRALPWQPMRLAAAMALVAIGLGGGWLLRGGAMSDTSAMAEVLVDEAMNAHRIYAAEILHPVEVAASDESHLISWLSKRLGVQLSAPDLSQNGFQLIGGRLLPADSGPAAQFMYEDVSGNRITVYATTGAPGILAAFQFEERGDVAGIYWQDAQLRYAVVGTLPRAQLSGIATEVYRQLI